MRYYYVSPACGQWVWIDWAKHRHLIRCPHRDVQYYPPGPADQHEAYVDRHQWPKEMEDIVRRLRGNLCTVPGCTRHADTLDHRIPWSKDGLTSVANLWPMCSAHNESKSDTDYELWLMVERLARLHQSLR